MPASQPAAVTSPGVECLWDLLQVAAEREARWRTDHQETSRCSYRASWDIWITCPGSRHEGGRPTPGTWGRCTPTVLARNTGDDDNHLAYRGACLGCGWVADQIHLLWHGGENAAAEDANDHTHPGWRDLPVVDRPPPNHGGAAHAKALAGGGNGGSRCCPPGGSSGADRSARSGSSPPPAPSPEAPPAAATT